MTAGSNVTAPSTAHRLIPSFTTSSALISAANTLLNPLTHQAPVRRECLPCQTTADSSSAASLIRLPHLLILPIPTPGTTPQPLRKNSASLISSATQVIIRKAVFFREADIAEPLKPEHHLHGA